MAHAGVCYGPRVTTSREIGFLRTSECTDSESNGTVRAAVALYHGDAPQGLTALLVDYPDTDRWMVFAYAFDVEGALVDGCYAHFDETWPDPFYRTDFEQGPLAECAAAATIQVVGVFLE